MARKEHRPQATSQQTLTPQQLAYREEARRKQWRFRKDPASYLANIERRLLQ